MKLKSDHKNQPNQSKITVQIGLLIFILIFCSCRSVRTISVLECVPPRYPVPNKIQNIALLNRSMSDHFINFTTDSISVEKRIGNNNVNFTRNFSDSIAADSVIIAAARSLFECQRFDVIVPIDRNLLRQNEKDSHKPLDPAFIEQTCRNYHVEGILVLEDFSQRTARRIKAPMPSAYRGIIRVRSQSFWRFYAPDIKPLDLRIGDTQIWESLFCHSLKSLYSSLPNIKEALTGGAAGLGMKVGYQFIPEWKIESKFYYKTGKKKVDAAISLIHENKWTVAAEIWGKFDSVSSRTLRSKIQFNLAVCAEVNGNLDEALYWADKSLNSKYYRRTELYLKQLDLYKSRKSIFNYNIAGL